MNRRMILYILGTILMIEAAFMALPLIVAAIYSERAGFSFLATMIFALVVGFLLTLLRPKSKVLYAKGRLYRRGPELGGHQPGGCHALYPLRRDSQLSGRGL